MAKDDVVFLIDAKDNASKTLDLVKDKSGGLQKSSLRLGDALKQLGLLNIPGLEFIARDFDAAKTSLEGYTNALNQGAKSTVLYRAGLYGVVAFAGYKLIEYFVDVKGAQERANETIKESITLYGELARAKVTAIQGFKADIGTLKGPEEQLTAMKALRDELRAQADAANEAVTQSSRALAEFKETQSIDQKVGLRGNEGPGKAALEAFLEMDKEAAKVLTDELHKTTDQINAMEKAERAAQAAKHDAYINKIADATSKYHTDLKEQRDTFQLTEREMLQYKMTLDGLDKPNRDFNLGLFDQVEAMKKAKEATEQTASADKMLLDGLRQQLDVLQLGADAARLKQAANEGASQAALKEAEALQKQIAAIKEKEKIEQDAAQEKARTEQDIARLQDKLKTESVKGRGAAPSLQAVESRLLARGTGGPRPDEQTATNTQKIADEIAKLRAQQAAADKDAKNKLDKIAEAVKVPPPVVITA